MPRSHRVQFENATYHATSHAVGNESVFISHFHYETYLRLLAEMKERSEVRLLAYALLTTHVHLVIQTARANVSEAIQWLHGRYAAWFNRHPHRCGHLFGSRFYSTLIDTDTYLLEATRYVHLNPVRAGLVEYAAQYRWSSYRSYLSQADTVPLDTSIVFDLISPAESDRVAEYRRFVEEPLAARLCRFPRGTPDWDNAALGAVADALEVLRVDICSHRSPQVRAAAVCLLADDLGLSEARIGAALGIQDDSVRRALSRIRQAAFRPAFAKRIAAAREVFHAAGLSLS